MRDRSSKFKFAIRSSTLPLILAFVVGLSAVAEDRSLDQLESSFQARLDELRAKHGFPGATAAFILSDGRSVCVATGMADENSGVAMTPETKSMSGSIGKTFVAATVIGLVQDDTLDLDAPISKWFGDEPWFDRLPNEEDITLRHLLSHSAGLEDHVYAPEFAKAVASMAEDPEFRLEPRELVEFILDKPGLFEAGKGFRYTDTGYILAGLIIEKATGRSYYDELQRRILAPLGLGLTVPANRRDIPGLTAGHMSPDNAFGLPAKTVSGGIMRFNPAIEWTGGGLATNSRDLVRWAKVLYAGKLFAKPYLDDLLSSPVPDSVDAERRYGLGVAIGSSPFGKTYGHRGWFPGYRSELAYFADHDVAVAIQVNSDVDMNIAAYLMSLAEIVVTN